MWFKVLHRLSRLLVVAAYAAAPVMAAASPLAGCPALDHAPHAGHLHGADQTHHNHHDRSGANPGDCLKCCVGACLIGVSLPVPFSGATTLALYGARVIYASEHAGITERSTAPDPGS